MQSSYLRQYCKIKQPVFKYFRALTIKNGRVFKYRNAFLGLVVEIKKREIEFNI